MIGYRHRLPIYLAILAIGSLGLVGCCDCDQPPPITTPPPPPASELVIEEMDTVVWMNVTNTFTLPPGEYFSDVNKELWQGVLMQLGMGTAPDGMLPLNLGVEIKTSDEEHLYPLEEFRWINIQAENPGKDDPMTAEHVPLLWPDPDNPSATCGQLDQCADSECLCLDLPCETPEQLQSVPARCLRQRSLHAYLKPQAIITYWMGPSGYNYWLRMEDGKHPLQSFQLWDDVAVTVMKLDGTSDSYEKVLRVTLKEISVTNHHRLMDPPGDG